MTLSSHQLTKEVLLLCEIEMSTPKKHNTTSYQKLKKPILSADQKEISKLETL